MRFLITTLILAVCLPAAEAKTTAGQCKDWCKGQYSFCMKRATTKQMRNGCKASRKLCKSQCKVHA